MHIDITADNSDTLTFGKKSDGYWGVTHKVPMFLLPVWKFLLCRVEWHLFDEVQSGSWRKSDDKISHSLYCDACGLTAEIDAIDGIRTEKRVLEESHEWE